MKKIIIILLLFSSCASSKPSWDRVNPDTLFEAINVKDLETREKDKNILKVLSFSTLTFIIYTLTNR
jgi:hypothetical protein|tara:strand:+ start:995 stop:1195 length:201 start_codon:yes stop_codon:yes gene_type:complete